MKLKVDAKSFVESVAWATKNYDAKNEKSYVKLNIEKDGEYFLSHRNLTSYMKQGFTVKDEKFEDNEETDTSLALDGKFLQRLAGALPNTGEIIISKDLNSRVTSLNVKTPQSSFTVPLLTTVPAEEPDYTILGEVNDNDFFLSLSRISKVADTANSGNQTFVGAIDISFNNPHEDDAQISMFATDKYAMSQIKLPFEIASLDEDEKEIANEVFANSFLLPAGSATIVPASKGLVAEVSLIAEKSKNGSLRFGYLFPDDRIALFSLLNVATFPNFEKVKKSSFDSTDGYIEVETSVINNAIKTISSLAWDDDDIFFLIDSNGVIACDRTEKNRISLEVDSIELPKEIDEDSAIRIRFVRSVINAALSPITTSKMKIGFASEKVTLFTLSAVTEDNVVLDNISSIAVVGKQ